VTFAFDAIPCPLGFNGIALSPRTEFGPRSYCGGRVPILITDHHVPHVLVTGSSTFFQLERGEGSSVNGLCEFFRGSRFYPRCLESHVHRAIPGMWRLVSPLPRFRLPRTVVEAGPCTTEQTSRCHHHLRPLSHVHVGLGGFSRHSQQCQPSSLARPYWTIWSCRRRF
jgi:hypothetical protein